MPLGHTGKEVCPVVVETLQDYGIMPKLGYFTSHNHGANDRLNSFPSK